MGSFAGFLGDAAKGYAQAAQLDTQRQFEAEQNKRSQVVDLLGKLAQDPTAHPETQQAALQMALETLHAPWNKPIKPDFNKLITAGPAQPTQTATTAGPTQAPQHDLTNLIPPGQPMPTPPTSAGVAEPQVSQQAQYTPPPNMGMRYTPTEQAQLAGQGAGAVAGGTLSGQIGARQKALEGMDLPPQERAMMTLGVPGMAGLMGAYGKGDEMPAQAALAAGYPLPAGVDPNDPNAWVRLQRNKVGGIVGSFSIPVPPEYAPTTKQGFTYQWDGSKMVAVPVTTTSQKQLPTPPGQAAAAPGAKVEPEKGKAVGKMKPPQALLIAPPTAPGQQPTAMAVRPGSKIPQGAVTAQGYSSTNVPTAGTRTRAEFANALLPHIDPAIALIKQMDKEGKLGPLKGRWNEFLAGRIGAGDPEFDQLRTDISLLQTGMMVPHVGARGGTSLIAKFKNQVDSGKMDATGLTTALGEWKKFLTGYAREGDLKGWGQEPAAAPDTSWHAQFGGATR